MHEGKDAVFGNPFLNVQYCRVLKTKMEKEGNLMQLLFADRNQMTKALGCCVVEEANRSLKKDKLPTLTGA